MADIFCTNCGLVFDSRVVPCPRCRRCSRCGTKCPEGVERCPHFEHELDADALAKLERSLDPGSPANQRAIRSCQRDWENSQLWERLTIWGHIVVALLTTAGTIMLSEVLTVAGMQNLWGRALICTVAIFVCLRTFLWVLRRGCLPWLLRDGASLPRIVSGK